MQSSSTCFGLQKDAGLSSYLPTLVSACAREDSVTFLEGWKAAGQLAMLAGSAAQDRTGGRTDAMCLCHRGLDTDDMVIKVARRTLTVPVHPNCAMFHIQGDTLTLKTKVYFLSTVGKKSYF